MESPSKLLRCGALLAVALIATAAQGQETPAYRETVTENPEPETDLKVVADYIAAVESADIEGMASLLADDVASYGPTNAEADSKEKMIEDWKENFLNQKDIEYSYVIQTFRVLSGDLAGDWVSTWGDYSYTTPDGVEVSIPLHVVNRVEDGKIAVSRAYYDRMSVFETLGYSITPPDGN